MNPRAGLEAMGFGLQSDIEHPPAYSFTESGDAEEQAHMYAISGVFTPIGAPNSQQTYIVEGLQKSGIWCKRHEHLDIHPGVSGSKEGGVLTFWGHKAHTLTKKIQELLSGCQPTAPISKPVRNPTTANNFNSLLSKLLLLPRSTFPLQGIVVM